MAVAGRHYFFITWLCDICPLPALRAALVTASRLQSADAVIPKDVNASPLEHYGNGQASAVLIIVTSSTNQQSKR
jgi:hypothetical protein